MNIKVLGSGCPNCIRLEKNVKQALTDLEMDAMVEKVTEFEDIMSYGVMSTPALVVDGMVLFSGRVLNPKQVADVLKDVA